MGEEIEAYLSASPSAEKAPARDPSRAHHGLYPGTVGDMRYKMPTYHVPDGWVAIANQKRYVSLYTCGRLHIEAFKAKHPRLKTGKGCLNFGDGDELPLEDIAEVVRLAMGSPSEPEDGAA